MAKYISGKAFAFNPKHIDDTMKRIKVEESGRSEKKRSYVEEVEEEEGRRVTSDEGSLQEELGEHFPSVEEKEEKEIEDLP